MNTLLSNFIPYAHSTPFLCPFQGYKKKFKEFGAQMRKSEGLSTSRTLKVRDGEKLHVDAVHVTSKDNSRTLLSNSGLHDNCRKKLVC